MEAIIQDPGPGPTWTVERAPGESDSAWAAFQVYLRSGFPTPEGVPRRSLSQISRDFKYPLSTIQKWASEWGWRARCSAVDQRILDSWIGAACSAGQDCASAISILAARIRAEAEAMILIPGPLFLTSDGRPDLSALVKAVDTIAKLDRLITGKTTANVGVGVQAGEWNLEALPLEDLEVLDGIRRKIGGGG